MITEGVQGRAPWLLKGTGKGTMVIKCGVRGRSMLCTPCDTECRDWAHFLWNRPGVAGMLCTPCDTECRDWAHFLRNRPRVAGHPPRGSELGVMAASRLSDFRSSRISTRRSGVPGIFRPRKRSETFCLGKITPPGPSRGPSRARGPLARLRINILMIADTMWR